ncbi:RNA polymerase-binding protein RbpA [Catenulispora sp. NF23]|uniref:RNA polymerase-binding protein RbpA n=1 Tax=Catenulispora pinistramenti TaxID=2705254 RepID=A0ABS5KH38_9ACTN|nr:MULTISPECIES: RNA polymerase-binding protein RbpA [Catenulispora]MBS2533980.1 RNA polymerase-binding protein RbpA [Catenulispora pinistramenti]MBS2545643.1 RNA polymerase-binding protein RbpA [Catenulispora pinistramenti]
MARSGIRGSRIGAGPSGENERGQLVTRVAVTFWCAIGHSTSPIFAASAEIPTTWDCHDCDRPAGLDPDNPPALVQAGPFKSHLAYVRDRRSDADADAILAEALTKLRTAR